MVTPAAKREAVDHLKFTFNKSERKSCKLMGISRRIYKYEHIKKDDSQLTDTLLSLAEKFPNYGFWKLYHREFKTSIYNHKPLDSYQENFMIKFKKNGVNFCAS